MNSKNIATVACVVLLGFSGIAKLALASDESRGFPTGEREGGGTRGEGSNCYATSNPPRAIAPEKSSGLTTTASPTLFVYVPQAEEAPALEFVLFDDNENLVYRRSFEANQTGIVSIHLPAMALSKASFEYQWYLICHSGYVPTVVDGGSLRRVAPNQNLINQLEQALPLQRVMLYQEANMWHEAMGTLATLRCERPRSLAVADKWTELLQVAGLGALSQESLDSYCSEDVELGVR